MERATVQAIACEVIFETERPLSRQCLADLTARAGTALRRSISRATVWRILHTADLKPWRFEYWIFPRDPKFIEKAEVILDLYAGFWQGTPLTPKDCIVSSDEKTSIQARVRRHRGLPTAPGWRAFWQKPIALTNRLEVWLRLSPAHPGSPLFPSRNLSGNEHCHQSAHAGRSLGTVTAPPELFPLS